MKERLTHTRRISIVAATINVRTSHSITTIHCNRDGLRETLDEVSMRVWNDAESQNSVTWMFDISYAW